jgi:hypothetical protein
MHNCIAWPTQRYFHAILAGTGHAFHVHAPEATVFVERQGGVWVLAEAKGPHNSSVPGWVVARLRAWLVSTSLGSPQPRARLVSYGQR